MSRLVFQRFVNLYTSTDCPNVGMTERINNVAPRTNRGIALYVAGGAPVLDE